MSGFITCTASEQLRLKAVSRTIFLKTSHFVIYTQLFIKNIQSINRGFSFIILCLFPEGRIMQQAERGWAGNKGRMGRVGETTASFHQHRCRYRVIVVCYCRAFGENDERHAVPFKSWL